MNVSFLDYILLWLLVGNIIVFILVSRDRSRYIPETGMWLFSLWLFTIAWPIFVFVHVMDTLKEREDEV